MKPTKEQLADPKWVPDIGEMCEVWVENAEYWAKITVLAVDKDTIVWRNGTDRKSYRGTRISNARPIKTQREELIDLVATALQTDDQDVTELCNKPKSMFIGGAAKAVDEVLSRFDLTEKDGE